MLNMMWAIRIVTPLSGKNGGAPIATNRVRSEAPRTISGVAIGRKMNRLVALRPAEVVAREGERDERAEGRRNQRREQGDDEADRRRRLAGPATPNGSSQAASVNPCHTKLDLPAGLLKLKRIITATGAIR